MQIRGVSAGGNKVSRKNKKNSGWNLGVKLGRKDAN